MTRRSEHWTAATDPSDRLSVLVPAEARRDAHTLLHAEDNASLCQLFAPAAASPEASCRWIIPVTSRARSFGTGNVR